MKLNISGRIFDTEDIYELTVREDRREVFITTEEDFFRIKYRSEKDIRDVLYWKRLSELTTKDVHEAIYTLIIVCEYFINSHEQCKGCPLFNNYCLLTTIPINWRES